ncbi:hypothetical protein GARC_1030 [Paraglaciecola arctica BSs20135]|uniref:Uncharacterized protein n=1 Tax=Paraglaciecola arctica BSs20135 TaxID=493475 RepID=K6Y244_9ALTE|nr:hypothetical protein GARC_1030 [Paraglaciecola arctica BSs20135]
MMSGHFDIKMIKLDHDNKHMAAEPQGSVHIGPICFYYYLK